MSRPFSAFGARAQAIGKRTTRRRCVLGGSRVRALMRWLSAYATGTSVLVSTQGGSAGAEDAFRIRG